MQGFGIKNRRGVFFICIYAKIFVILQPQSVTIMKLYEIRQAIGSCAEVTGEDDLEIRYLLTDSRLLDVQRDDVQGTKAAQTLFFAIKTAKNDGAKYIPELQAKGVKAFVTGDAVQALQNLAAYVRQQFDGTVIGITGSNGKTVVKEWLCQLLKDEYTVIRSPKSYNSQIGVPLSVWQLTQIKNEKFSAHSGYLRSRHQSAG